MRGLWDIPSPPPPPLVSQANFDKFDGYATMQLLTLFRNFQANALSSNHYDDFPKILGVGQILVHPPHHMKP